MFKSEKQLGQPPAKAFLLATLLLALAAAIWLVYLPGLSGSLYFDDAPNLLGLEQIDDRRSAAEFIVSGQSGPTGRPLALASFLLNIDDWPGQPNQLRKVNILIHVINALLVVWIALMLARAQDLSEGRAIAIALLAGALWGLQPLLASTSMMIVQRMTSLSAMFVLAGLVFFVACHQQLLRRPVFSLVAMSLGMLGFTTLATFSKENGALLPLYALALTILLPVHEARRWSAWRLWKAVFLWLPTIMIGAYLVSRVPYPESTELMRDFSAWERVITQAELLWRYLFNALLPMSTSQFGPFHDDLVAHESILDPRAMLATCGWMFTIVLAIKCRHSIPVFSFGVVWFLGGHLLESTTVPLELYFEHRNYLPLVGPAIGLAWLATSAPARWYRLAFLATIVYTGLLAWTTASVTQKWGNPLAFAEEQYRHNRESARAAGFFASHLLAMNRPDLALTIIDQAMEHDADALRLSMASYQIRCAHDSVPAPEVNVDRLSAQLSVANGDRNLARALHDLLQHAASTDCPDLSGEEERLVDALSENPEMASLAETRYWLHRSRALISAHSGDIETHREELAEALQARFEPYALEMLIQSHLQHSDTQGACERLRTLGQRLEANPIRKLYTRLVVERMAELIEQQTKETQPCHPSS